MGPEENVDRFECNWCLADSGFELWGMETLYQRDGSKAFSAMIHCPECYSSTVYKFTKPKSHNAALKHIRSILISQKAKTKRRL
jgi:hypothetical protein